MKRRYRKIYDISGIVLLSLALAVIVRLSSEGHIYFSRTSGYYEDAFTLEIRGGSRNIYYTLDGSEPTQEDYLYDKSTPILVTDAATNETTYAAQMVEGGG